MKHLDSLTVGQLIDRAHNLKSAMVANNAGSEESMDQVNHVEDLREEYECILSKFAPDIQKLLRLGHL